MSRGKAVNRIIARSSQRKQLIDDFYRFSGAAAEHSGTLDDMLAAATQLVGSLKPPGEGAQLKGRVACMSAILAQFPKLHHTRARLRASATHAFESLLVEQIAPF